MLTQVSQPEIAVEQIVCGLRDHDLPAVGSGHDPCRPVHVHPDVLGRIKAGLPGVYADADPDAALGEDFHRFSNCDTAARAEANA